MAQGEAVTESLTADDLARLQRITTEKDKEEALQFAVMLSERIEQQQKSQMKPEL